MAAMDNAKAPLSRPTANPARITCDRLRTRRIITTTSTAPPSPSSSNSKLRPKIRADANPLHNPITSAGAAPSTSTASMVVNEIGMAKGASHEGIQFSPADR